MPSARRYSVFPALIIVLIGICIALFGHLRSAQPLTPTTGVITRSSTLGGMKSSIWRSIHYTFRVAGREYGGEATVKDSLAHNAPYQVGRDQPVFFVSSAPERSYPFGPPLALPWIVCGVVVVVVGSIIAFLTWTAITPNHAMERTAGSFGSSPSMKFHPRPAATRSPASRRSSYSR